MKLVLLQTLCFTILWVGVAPNRRGAVMYGLSQAEAQGPPLKSGLTKGLRLAAFTIATPPTMDENFHLGGGSENPRPCMLTKRKNAYKTFRSRHVLRDTPSTKNTSSWEKFLREHKLCNPNRLTQSFLRYKDESLIKKVCTPEGGKIYKENLCISNNNLSFITVMIDNNCKILNITKENKYIILACDKIINACMPVHFHGGEKSLEKNLTKACSDEL